MAKSFAALVVGDGSIACPVRHFIEQFGRVARGTDCIGQFASTPRRYDPADVQVGNHGCDFRVAFGDGDHRASCSHDVVAPAGNGQAEHARRHGYECNMARTESTAEAITWLIVDEGNISETSLVHFCFEALTLGAVSDNEEVNLGLVAKLFS